MSENAVQAYLEEELLNKRSIVTFRLLSRKLKIHVNEAKNALATFYTKTRGNQQHVFATFWLSGETKESGSSGEGVSAWSTMVVDEGSLENAKASFKSITSLHVYALTPSPLENVSDLCAPTGIVREIDNAGGAELAATVGKISNQTIVALPTKPTKDNAQRAQASSSSKPTPSVQPKVKEEQKPSTSANEPTKAKPKQTGTLDWSKGRTKEVKKEAVEPSKAKKPKVKEEEDSSKDTGKKRKGSPLIVPKQEPTEAPKPKPKPVVTKQEETERARIKKGAIVSDDDTDDEPVVKSRGRFRQHKVVDEDYDIEPSLKAMMDIDDSEVIKASSSRPSTIPTPQASIAANASDEEPPASEPAEDSMAVDEDLSDDPAPKPKPRQRKVKKAIPVGRNGLKKKRVMKSKSDFDEKGYLVTIDYSSYESVDEEEPEPEPSATKNKRRGRVTVQTSARSSLASTKPTAKLSDSEPESKPAVAAASAPLPRANPSGLKKPAPAKPTPAATKGKPTGAKGGGQKSLNSFFGAKPKQ